MFPLCSATFSFFHTLWGQGAMFPTSRHSSFLVDNRGDKNPLTQKDSSAGQTEKLLNILLWVSTVVIGVLVSGSELSAAPPVLATGLTTAGRLACRKINK